MTDRELDVAVAKVLGAVSVAIARWDGYESGDLLLFPAGYGSYIAREMRGEGVDKYTQPWSPSTDANLAIGLLEKLSPLLVTIGGNAEGWCVVVSLEDSDSGIAGDMDTSLARAICHAIVAVQRESNDGDVR